MPDSSGSDLGSLLYGWATKDKDELISVLVYTLLQYANRDSWDGNVFKPKTSHAHGSEVAGFESGHELAESALHVVEQLDTVLKRYKENPCQTLHSAAYTGKIDGIKAIVCDVLVANVQSDTGPIVDGSGIKAKRRIA